jgi:ribosome-associated protein
MTPGELSTRHFEAEFVFSASRSSGPGGQNVNKVNTRIELRFNIELSGLLSDDEKEIIKTKLRTRINRDGELVITEQTGRTQLSNRKLVEEKFYELLSAALTLKRKRRPTRPTAASVDKRLGDKKIRKVKKESRKFRDVQDD